MDKALKLYEKAAEAAGNRDLVKRILALREEEENDAIEPLADKNGSYDNENGVSDNVRTTNANNMSSENLDSEGEINFSKKFTPNEKLDKTSGERYNLYTATDDFIREVAPNDRKAFSRSLANKTSGIVDGEIKNIYIYSTSKVYAFRADGYMHGEMINSFSTSDKQLWEDSNYEYDQIDQNTEIADLWTEAVQSRKGRRGSNSLLYERGGRSNIDDRLSDNSSSSNGTRDIEREWANPRSKEDYDEIIKKLREIYGLDTVKRPDDTKFSYKANAEKASLTKGEAQKQKANYESDKVYTKAEISKMVESLNGLSSIPKRFRAEIVNDIWTAFNSRYSPGQREQHASFLADKLFARMMQESGDTFDNTSQEGIYTMEREIHKALKKIAREGGSPSTRSKLEAEFNTSEAGYWKKQRDGVVKTASFFCENLIGKYV